MSEPASKSELGWFENDLACKVAFTKRDQTEFLDPHVLLGKKKPLKPWGEKNYQRDGPR